MSDEERQAVYEAAVKRRKAAQEQIARTMNNTKDTLDAFSNAKPVEQDDARLAHERAQDEYKGAQQSYNEALRAEQDALTGLRQNRGKP